MGYLYYGTNSYRVELDDRPLAHLKIAVLSLLRAGKGLALSFDRPADQGGGRETLWISPATEIRFRFHGSRPPLISVLWVRAIIATAQSVTGGRMVPEPVSAAADEDEAVLTAV